MGQTSQSCVWCTLRKNWQLWALQVVRSLLCWTPKALVATPLHPLVCQMQCLEHLLQVAPHRTRAKAHPRHAASIHHLPHLALGLAREWAVGPVRVEMPSHLMMTVHVHKAPPPAHHAVCTVALCLTPLRTDVAAARMLLIQLYTAYASGRVYGVLRACSTTACQTLKASSGNHVPVKTRWAVGHTRSAVPAGWHCWHFHSLCPACAATCPSEHACAVGRDVAAVVESTRLCGETWLCEVLSPLKRCCDGRRQKGEHLFSFKE